VRVSGRSSRTSASRLLGPSPRPRVALPPGNPRSFRVWNRCRKRIPACRTRATPRGLAAGRRFRARRWLRPVRGRGGRCASASACRRGRRCVAASPVAWQRGAIGARRSTGVVQRLDGSAGPPATGGREGTEVGEGAGSVRAIGGGSATLALRRAPALGPLRPALPRLGLPASPARPASPPRPRGGGAPSDGCRHDRPGGSRAVLCARSLAAAPSSDGRRTRASRATPRRTRPGAPGSGSPRGRSGRGGARPAVR